MPISSATIKRVTAQLYERSLKAIPRDTRAFLQRATRTETSPTGRATLAIMLESADGAQRDDALVCTDVGIPTYSLKIGTRVQFDGPVRAAIRDGFADLAAHISPPILKMVTNPLTHERSYAGKDMPCLLYTSPSPRDS